MNGGIGGFHSRKERILEAERDSLPIHKPRHLSIEEIEFLKNSYGLNSGESSG